MRKRTLSDAVASEDSRRSDGSLQGMHCLVQEIDAPSQLLFRWQLRLSYGVVKLVASHNPSHSNLRGDVGEASDHHHGNSLFLDFFCDRSAATCAGSSGSR